MIKFDDVQAQAEESIVLALKERLSLEGIAAWVFQKREPAPAALPRPPAKAVDLDEDLEDFISRYPKTLEYLAK